MERRNLFHFATASDAWKQNGFVDLSVLRDLAETVGSTENFSGEFDRLVRAFNGSARSHAAIEEAARSGAPQIVALKQHLQDIGAWGEPYSLISADKYRSYKDKVSEENGFDPFQTKAEKYPYYQPGVTLGYDVEWIQGALVEAKQRFAAFESDRTSDTAILVGNGPSLNKVDFNLFKGRDVFISNYAIKHPELRAVAKGVAVTNYLVAEQEPYLFGLDAPVWKFFPFWLRHTILPDDRTLFLNAAGGKLFFSENVLERVAWHSTVSYFWLQILYSAGYQRVLMTGFDNSYQQSSKAKEGDLVNQKDDDPNHFDPTYFKGKQWQAADTDKMEDTYVLSKQHYEADGRELVNCTVGGALEVLRRAPLDEELEKSKPVSKSVEPRVALVTAFWRGDADGAEKHWRASRRFSAKGVDHLHVFKHGEAELPHHTMRNVFCADLDARYPDAVAKPHPAGPNLTFAYTVHLMKKLGYTHFFWFEPDCVPTQDGWLEPFLQAIDENPNEPIIGVGGGTVVPNKPHWKNHFAGCSVYSVDALAQIDWDRFIEKELDVSFDVWLSRELGYIELGEKNNADQTDTIIFGSDRYNWSVLRSPKSVTVGMFEHWRPEKFLSKEQLKERLGWKQFNLFHAVKDPELLELSAARKRPKAAIIIINYNNEKYIREAIETALLNQQSYAETEVLVVDDGSTDRSKKIIESFGDAIVSIHLEHGLNVPNYNQQRALKAALDHTDAELIFLMDGDDRFAENKVETSVGHFDDLNVVIFQHTVNLVDGSGRSLGQTAEYFPDRRITPELYAKENRTNFFQPTSGLVLRRCYLEKALSWLVPDEHNDVWLDVRLTRIAPYFGKVVSSPAPLGDWRRHAASDSIRTDNVTERLSRHHDWFREEAKRQALGWNLERTKLLKDKTKFVEGFRPQEKAHVDETDVIAYLLRERTGRDRVMLDVGAHFGISAHFFDKLGWSIHCFEPDPSNRTKLNDRFKTSRNVIIDPRAVSDEPATNVQFFTSEQSTGISGLHAFHDSHVEAGLVDITTLKDVIAEREIKRVDFLKIDVEGFDLNVLRGVPWGTVRPEVIECEFEDAKTLKLGHDWRGIADFLQDRGYTVYVSEWNPIVEYGVAHDWRRVFPYPAYDMPDDAWGNLLAFRDDPGVDAVVGAFRAKIKYRKSESNSNNRVNGTGDLIRIDERNKTMLKQTPGYAPHRISGSPDDVEPASPGTAWYSGIAHKIRGRSQAMFDLLRFFHRALAHLVRKPVLAILLLTTIATVAWIVVQTPISSDTFMFTSATGLALTALLVYVAHRAHFHADDLQLKYQNLEHGFSQLHGQRMDAAAELKALSAATKKQASQLASVAASVRKFEEQFSAAGVEANEQHRRLGEISSKLASVTKDQSSLTTRIDAHATENAQSLKHLSESVSNQGVQLFDRVSGFENALAEVESAQESLDQKSHASEESMSSANQRLATVEKWTPKDNAQWFQHFNRHLRREHIETLQKEWRKRLSLPLSEQVLGYMASRICDLERRLDGRLATSVEDMLLRSLVAQAIKAKSVHVLEIGTLFGTGAAIIHDAISSKFDEVHFSLLDPLEGYYNGAQTDILTGQVIDESTLHRNFERAGIQGSDYSLIKHLSTEIDAIQMASDAEYDLLIIDGDHSYAGVKTDFENYAKFVKLGGYIIFDDYNSADWPEVKQYVDDEMPNHDFVSFVGASWRTCVYRVVKPGLIEKKTPPSRRKSASKNSSTSSSSTNED